jgi:hypothetical protein
MYAACDQRREMDAGHDPLEYMAIKNSLCTRQMLALIEF